MSYNRGVLDNEPYDLEKYLNLDDNINGDHNDDKLEQQRIQGEIDYIREALLMYGFPSIGNLMPGCTMQDTKDTLETLNKLIR